MIRIRRIRIRNTSNGYPRAGIGDTASNRTDLAVSLGLLNIINVDENGGKLRINLWLSLYWKDPRLRNGLH